MFCSIYLFIKSSCKHFIPGHFLLTNLLLEDLKKTAGEDGEARVVVVTSSIHDPEANKKWMGSKQCTRHI